MIELPESTTLARQLADTLTGRRVKQVEAAHTPHGFAFYSMEPALYGQTLRGQAVCGAASTAGYVELHFEGHSLFFHDGANLRLLPPGAPPPKKHQLYVEFEDGGALVVTVQMYAGLHLAPTGGLDTPYYAVARARPSPLTDAFDRATFASIVDKAGPKASAKALLATEQRIPGLGNGCLQDILWAARINPQTKVGALAQPQLDALFDAVKSTLAAMAAAGGRDTEKDLFGQPGGYQTILSNKTAAYACPRCGGAITRKAYMGGNVYFCAGCQPG